jgi:uncharacterized protein YwbE
LIRRLVGAVLILGILGVGADIVLRRYAESEISKRVRAEVESTSVSTNISSFPFVVRLAASGTVGEVKTHLDKPHVGPLIFDSIDVDLKGVQVDRNQLLSHQDVKLRKIDSGQVTAELTESTLAQALGVPVRLEGGAIHVTVLGKDATATLSVKGNKLLFDVVGRPLSLPIPQTSILPCAADATVADGRIRLTCTIHEIPPALLQATTR